MRTHWTVEVRAGMSLVFVVVKPEADGYRATNKTIDVWAAGPEKAVIEAVRNILRYRKRGGK